MKRRSIVILLAIVISACLAYLVYNQTQKSKMKDREATFISLFYLATEAAGESYEDRPKTIDDLLVYHGGSASILLEPFQDGIHYEVSEEGFILEEPYRRPTVHGKTDRLIAAEDEWPYWEVTRKRATKYGIEIPSRYK